MSATNYIFNSDDTFKLIKLADLPYTLLAKPGGKIIYAKAGGIQPTSRKKEYWGHLPLSGVSEACRSYMTGKAAGP